MTMVGVRVQVRMMGRERETSLLGLSQQPGLDARVLLQDACHYFLLLSLPGVLRLEVVRHLLGGGVVQVEGLVEQIHRVRVEPDALEILVKKAEHIVTLMLQ